MPTPFHRISAALPLGIALALVMSTHAENEVTYNRDIRPILSDKCFQCHGPDSENRKGDLRLDLRDEAIKAEAFIPGDPARSELLRRIHERNPKEVMPPPESPRQLSANERDTLSRWITQGATYEPLWSFTPLPASVSVPDPKHPAWPINEIDRFIAARLDHESLTPSHAAPPERWLRRISFDLTGLPPANKELDAFLTDKSADARARAVDRLLDSPRYGEKMAITWLDVARYADSFGYQSDIETNAWPYRDWVVSAFNQNLPWDQFITWQIAGDLLPQPTRDQIIATAFNRIHRKTQEGGSIEAEFRQEGISDRIHTFGSAFLALTFECTRCHDHKYDPLTQKDYYSLGAFFNSIDEWGLLHGTRSIQPNPCLFLSTPEQDKAIAEQTAAVASAEAALSALMKARESDFQTWLAAPTVGAADLSGSYNLDDTDRFANSVDSKRPAKSNTSNKPVPGHRGQALSFTGDDPLELGKHQASNCEDSLSVSFWLKPGEEAKRSLIFHDSEGADPGYNGFELLLEDGRLSWTIAREWPGNCISIRSPERLPVHEWNHVSVSYDGSSEAAGLKIFLNGGELACEIIRDKLTKNCASGKGINFGERFRESGLRNGVIDEIRIHTRPLSALEVHALKSNQNLAEVITTTSRDETGLTTLRDYYFSAVDPEWRKATTDLKSLRKSLRQTIEGVRELPVMKEMNPPRLAWVLARGAYDQPIGEPLTRNTPTLLPPFPNNQPLDRLGLARWLIEPNHPLTARVQVNRFWQHFFGRGLVATPENFGSQGELPSHPELLDWLARDFITHGWDTKRLCKQIVLSATYGQDSKASKELRDKDPNNILLARGPAKRLSGEDLRDHALELAGLLQNTIGGPPAKPYLPDSASWRVLNNMVPEYKRDTAPGIYRRSFYTFWRRTAPPPNMLAFDVPSRDVCTVSRQQTNTPLQPLVMLNDPQFVEASRGLAIRMFREGGSDLTKQIHWLFRKTLGRYPSPDEMSLLAGIYHDQLAIFRQEPKQADAYLKVGDLPIPNDLPAIDLAAATVLANAVINLDEAITLR